MITGLEIYSLSKDKIEMHELTMNTIVLFNNSDLKYKFVQEFWKLTDEEDESILYCTIINDESEDHEAQIKTVMTYKPTSIYMADNEQRFIFTTEAPFVLQMTSPYDLWFCDTNKDNEISVWSFMAFEGCLETWEKGVEEVYKDFANGRYGCYEGYGR